MATEEENPCRETALQLDQETIAAIIDGVAAKLQKAPVRKGDEPSASSAGPSRGAGKETRTMKGIYKYRFPPSTRQGVKTSRGHISVVNFIYERVQWPYAARVAVAVGGTC